MQKIGKYLFFILLLSFFAPHRSFAEENKINLDLKEFIFGHLEDSYEWHITDIGNKRISIPLPVIVHSKQTGWHVFLSSQFRKNNGTYQGFSIAPKGSNYEGKIIEYDASGTEIRPLDLSFTKTACSAFINSILLIAIILSVAYWYRSSDNSKAPKGFVGFMEMFITGLVDDIIKPAIGENYRKFAPFLLTIFFFILLNNIMGLVPIFPGGANVTGNISVTFVLAFCSFVAINVFGSREYWKEIVWPDVPIWMKAPPFPILPIIEFFGIFIKPFALMIRLFANIFAGHTIILSLSSLIFITATLGFAINAGLTIVSILFSIFMLFLELLVAFIQAYVFTMLSSMFIGFAQEKK